MQNHQAQTLKEHALAVYRENTEKQAAEQSQRRASNIESDKAEIVRQLKTAGIEIEPEVYVEDGGDSWRVFARIQDLTFYLKTSGYCKFLSLVDEAGCPECGLKRASYKITDLSALGSTLSGNWDYHECRLEREVDQACREADTRPPSIGEQLVELIEGIARNAISNSPIIDRLMNQ